METELLVPTKFTVTNDIDFVPEPVSLCYFFNAEFKNDEDAERIGRAMVRRVLRSRCYAGPNTHHEIVSVANNAIAWNRPLTMARQDQCMNSGKNIVGLKGPVVNSPIIWGIELADRTRVYEVMVVASMLAHLNRERAFVREWYNKPQFESVFHNLIGNSVELLRNSRHIYDATNGDTTLEHYPVRGGFLFTWIVKFTAAVSLRKIVIQYLGGTFSLHEKSELYSQVHALYSDDDLCPDERKPEPFISIPNNGIQISMPERPSLWPQPKTRWTCKDKLYEVVNTYHCHDQSIREESTVVYTCLGTGVTHAASFTTFVTQFTETL